MTISQVAKTLEKFTIDHSPMILTGLAAAGVLTTAVLTGKASFKAAELLREEKEIRFADNTFDGEYVGGVGPLTNKEKFLVVYKLYIPALANAAMTVTCVIVANRIGHRRAAAMAAAYTISEKAFEDYREKVVEKLGKGKERDVRDAVAQDRVKENPIGRNEVIITGGGEVLCFDMYTQRYFKSDMESLKKAQNDINYRIINDSYASLNDFYSKIGLSGTPSGEEVGWNTDKGLELIFSAVLSEEDKPCIAITFYTQPVRDYYLTH